MWWSCFTFFVSKTYLQSLISYEKKDQNSSIVKKVVAKNLVKFEKYFALEQKVLPHYIKNEFTSFLNCGLYSLGFLKFHCSNCNNNFLLPFFCKKKGICPSCGGRRMSQTAAHLRDFFFLKELSVNGYCNSLFLSVISSLSTTKL